MEQPRQNYAVVAVPKQNPTPLLKPNRIKSKTPNCCSYNKTPKICPPPNFIIKHTISEIYRESSSSVGVEFGHFLHVDPDALAVKQHEVHSLDGGRHRCHKVAGDGLQNELSGRLLRKTVSIEEKHTAKHAASQYSETGTLQQPPDGKRQK